MMKAIVIILICCSVVAARHCYGNHRGLTEEDVILLVMNDIDRDDNQQITSNEFTYEFITKYDHDRNGQVEEHEFVHEWHRRYHDDHEFPKKLFHVLRVTENQYLSTSNVQAMMDKFDVNGDQRLSYGEFHAALMKVYKDCLNE